MYSLIIEDLAKWKTFLCDRVDILEASLQTVLDENRKNRHLLKSAHEYVKHKNKKDVSESNSYGLGV